MRNPMDTKKYFLSFLITLIVFISAVSVNNFLDGKRYNEIRSVQDDIELDFISSETQFDLLKEISCKNVTSDSLLSRELGALTSKLSYIESNDGSNGSSELTYLKKKYTLLQIKDHILMKKIAEKCSNSPTTIMYFYKNKEACPECDNVTKIMSYLRKEYPEDLRIYSFEYNLELSALETLKRVYQIEDNLPALVIKEDTYYGSTTIDEIKKIIPELKKIDRQRAIDAEKALKNASTSTSTPTKI